MKTYSARPHEIIQRWYVVDAAGKPAGRLAASVAAILRGKHKPSFTPHVDTGDYVIIVNAEKVRLTGGSKAQERIYHHSQYPGGLKSVTRGEMLAKRPDEYMRRLVKGMLPHNTLGRRMLGKLKVYSGPDHPHQAQQPEPLSL